MAILYCLDDQFKENEMGGACSACGGEMHMSFWWGDFKKRDNLEELGIHRRMLSKWLLIGMVWEGMVWINLAKGRASGGQM
jgi:hypothetical protein